MLTTIYTREETILVNDSVKRWKGRIWKERQENSFYLVITTCTFNSWGVLCLYVSKYKLTERFVLQVRQMKGKGCWWHFRWCRCVNPFEPRWKFAECVFFFLISSQSLINFSLICEQFSFCRHDLVWWFFCPDALLFTVLQFEYRKITREC